MLGEAEKLAQQQQALEREQAEVEIQIKLREGHLMDATMVGEALKNFTEVFKHLTFDDKISLLDLLIERICVTPADPENKKIPGELGANGMQLRTSRYQIEIYFHIKSLFKELCGKAGNSSYLALNGGEGG